MGKVTVRNRNAGKFDKDGKRKAANWEYRFEIAPIGGKRQQKTKSGFRTQQEAYDAGNIAYSQYNSAGRTFEPNDISVADYLDYWLENAIKSNVGNSYTYNTYQDYESRVRIHLKPAFGQYRLYALQFAPDVIQKWIDNMKGKGFAKSMVSNNLACLSGALNYAVQPLQYITTNPCSFVKIGRMPVDRKSLEKREYVCPAEDFSKILQRFPQGNNFYLPLMIGYHLGTRISESYGFNLLEDLNLKTDEISIQHQLTKENGVWFYRPPKYESSRTVKIGSVLKQALKEELLARKKFMVEYGPYYMKTYLLPDSSIVQFRADITVPHKEIWPTAVKENGELLTPQSFKYCARVIHYELGNPLFHYHCLRHTHGTILAENGVNPKTVMERLGHKDIKTTLQTYTFNTEMMQTKAVEIFESAIINQ